MGLKDFYNKKYKALLFIPFILLILAIAQIITQSITTGEFVQKDYSLKGGFEVNVQTTETIDVLTLKQELQEQYPDIDDVKLLTQAGRITGVAITDSNIEDQTSLVETIKTKLNVNDEQVSVSTIGSSLAKSFFRQTFIAVLVAFLFMGIVVFFYFKVPIPSLAVILAAASDIIVTLAIVNILGMKLGTAGVAAFLMLIGYSVDTNILLSTKLLKRTEGTIIERLFSAMKTGFTMSATTLAALIAALIFTQSPIIKQIMTILIIGLIIDMINTWIQNAGILRIYLGKKHGQD